MGKLGSPSKEPKKSVAIEHESESSSKEPEISVTLEDGSKSESEAENL